MPFPYLRLWMGPMTSSKTSRLVLATEQARLHLPATSVFAVKPRIDSRSPSSVIVSRTGLAMPADIVTDSLDLIDLNELRRKAMLSSSSTSTTAANTILLALDEVQFYSDGSLLRLWERACCDASDPSMSVKLAVAGLDFDYRRQPFGQALELARAALNGHRSVVIERLTSRCTYSHHSHDSHHHQEQSPPAATDVCGGPACYTQKLLPSTTSASSSSSSSSKVVEVGGEELYAPACEHHHKPHPIAKEEWFGKNKQLQ